MRKNCHAFCKQGFTLIELLVVVLIIGIFAAIALPQYQLAVEKAKANAVLPLLRSIDSSQKLHYLTYGAYTIDVTRLTDIELPPYTITSNQATTQTIEGKNFKCLLRCGDNPAVKTSYSAYCYPKSNYISIEKYYDRSLFFCWASKTDARAQRVCQAIANLSTNTGSNEGSFYYSF